MGTNLTKPACSKSNFLYVRYPFDIGQKILYKKWQSMRPKQHYLIEKAINIPE